MPYKPTQLASLQVWVCLHAATLMVGRWFCIEGVGFRLALFHPPSTPLLGGPEPCKPTQLALNKLGASACGHTDHAVISCFKFLCGQGFCPVPQEGLPSSPGGGCCCWPCLHCIKRSRPLWSMSCLVRCQILFLPGGGLMCCVARGACSFVGM